MGTKQIISKNISANSTEYIGKDGELWVDTDTNKIKISDGATAGGVDLVGLGGGGGATTWATLGDKNNADGPLTIALGLQAGETNQGLTAVAIGGAAGGIDQSTGATAVGYQAGYTGQGVDAVAVGKTAGRNNQSENAVAIGDSAGGSAQALQAVAIGQQAGETSQSEKSVAIGPFAGMEQQGDRAVAIGHNTGKTNQGTKAVAIGTNAGTANQHDNSIVINATGIALNTTQVSEFIVKPVRNVAGVIPAGFKQVAYNPTTGEFISYG